LGSFLASLVPPDGPVKKLEKSQVERCNTYPLVE
jgi:hypothetical protein